MRNWEGVIRIFFSGIPGRIGKFWGKMPFKKIESRKNKDFLLEYTPMMRTRARTGRGLQPENISVIILLYIK